MATAKILLGNGEEMNVVKELVRVHIQPAHKHLGEIFSVGFGLGTNAPLGRIMIIKVPENVPFDVLIDVIDQKHQLAAEHLQFDVVIEGYLPHGKVTLRGPIHCGFDYAVFAGLKILRTSDVQIWHKGGLPDNVSEEVIF